MTFILHSLERFGLVTVAALLAVGCRHGCRQEAREGPSLADSTVSPSTAECAERSSCGQRRYCSADQKCICVESAEGVLRRARIPETCHMKLCKTSADCADVGPGYFCDTPNSGCCTDPPKELPRCVAPYGAGPAPDTSSSVKGAWIGTTDPRTESETPVQLQLEEHGADISGKVLLASPGGTKFFELDKVTGTRTINALKLTSSAGLTIEANKAGEDLVGTIRFPPFDVRSQPYVARLQLKRR